jgi:iron complex outermembrane receptor protein
MYLQRTGKRYMRIAAIVAATLLSAGGLSAAEQAAASIRHYQLNIPRQSLDNAIRELAQQTGLQIARFGSTIDGNSVVGPISGNQTAEEALKTLLAPQGLTYTLVNDTTIAIIDPRNEPTDNSPQARQSVNGEDGGYQRDGGNNDLPHARGSFRLAQQGGQDASSADETPAGKDSDGKDPGLDMTTADATKETVVIAGSRLGGSAHDSAVPTNVYSREMIDASGTATVMSFLNTLSEVSIQNTTTGNNQQLAGATVVQLRGLPGGTTLVLVDGRRVTSSSGLLGANGGAFDLNSIPLAAVERIEVIPSGSSAIYGGDALGGVVNIVMKKDFNGVEANVRYGMTDHDDYHETQFNVAAGTSGAGWSLSAVALFTTNSELTGADRSIMSNNDYRAFGGFDSRSTYSDPGNVCSADGGPLRGLASPCAGVPHGSTGVGLTPASFAATDGKLNYTSSNMFYSILSPARKYGTFIHASHDLGASAEVFTDLLYNHLEQKSYYAPPATTVSVPGANPNNPFGEDVGVQYRFLALGRHCYCQNTDFVRPLLGLRGTVGGWSWELAGWTTRDWDSVPYTLGVENTDAINSALASGAFNPFAAGPGATPAVLGSFFSDEVEKMRSATDSVNAFVRGQLVQLPAGPLEGLIGAEFQRDTLAIEIPDANFDVEFHRRNTAAFMELKVPILPGMTAGRGNEMLTSQFALRYDNYSDFGSRTSPEAGIVFRPIPSLTLRASYSAAFKPPPLNELYGALTSYPGLNVSDPLRGNETTDATLHFGGNRSLKAETGWSRNIGLVFSPSQVPDLNLTLTQWTIRLKNGFTQPTIDFFVNNASTYPGTVVRSSPAAGDPYGVGRITDVYDVYENIGFIHESGVDLAVNWRARTRVGDFTPTLSASRVYQYDYELDPTLGEQTGLSQANDDATYAPRWKGVAGLSWTGGPLTLGVTGRYIGPYRDVTDVRSNPKELGNFLYTDLMGRFELGKAILQDSKIWSRTFVAAGVRNAFNKLPPYADYGFGQLGYDPNEYELEGRFMWVQAGMRL